MRSKPNKKKLMIAIIAGVFTSFIALNMIGSFNKKIQEQNDTINGLKQKADQTVTSVSQQNQKQDVVVAKTNITSGTQFSNDNIQIKSLDEKDVPPGSVKSTDIIIGMTANADIPQDSPVTTSRVAEFNKKVIDIPPGMRALTIPTDLVQGFASYIKVGSKVDIISATKNGAGTADVVLQNIKIITFEGKDKGTLGDDVPSTALVAGITILVPANSVPRLVSAMVGGRLQLVTRNQGDDQLIATPAPKPAIRPVIPASIPSIPNINPGKLSLPPLLPTTPGTSLGGLPSPATPPSKPKAPPKKVELIQANVKTDVTFDN